MQGCGLFCFFFDRRQHTVLLTYAIRSQSVLLIWLICKRFFTCKTLIYIVVQLFPLHKGAQGFTVDGKGRSVKHNYCYTTLTSPLIIDLIGQQV